MDNFAFEIFNSDSKIDKLITVAKHYLKTRNFTFKKLNENLYECGHPSFTFNFDDLKIDRSNKSVTITFLLKKEIQREFYTAEQ
jgi:hypothetical protein